MLLNGQKRWRISVQARLCLQVWTRMELKTDMILNLQRLSLRLWVFPSLRQVVQETLNTYMKHSNMERQMQSLQHLYSITRNTQLEKQKNTLGPRECLLDFNQKLHRIKGRFRKLWGTHCCLV